MSACFFSFEKPVFFFRSSHFSLISLSLGDYTMLRNIQTHTHKHQAINALHTIVSSSLLLCFSVDVLSFFLSWVFLPSGSNIVFDNHCSFVANISISEIISSIRWNYCHSTQLRINMTSIGNGKMYRFRFRS